MPSIVRCLVIEGGGGAPGTRDPGGGGMLGGAAGRDFFAANPSKMSRSLALSSIEVISHCNPFSAGRGLNALCRTGTNRSPRGEPAAREEDERL